MNAPAATSLFRPAGSEGVLTISRRTTMNNAGLKWRRVASGAVLSQGGIRRNGSARFASGRRFDRSSPRHRLASKLVPFYARHKRNVEHRRHSISARRNGSAERFPNWRHVAHKALPFRLENGWRGRRGAVGQPKRWTNCRQVARKALRFPLWGKGRGQKPAVPEPSRFATKD